MVELDADFVVGKGVRKEQVGLEDNYLLTLHDNGILAEDHNLADMLK